MDMVEKKPFNSYKEIMQAISASLVQSGKVVTWERGISGQLGHEDMVSSLQPKHVKLLKKFCHNSCFCCMEPL